MEQEVTRQALPELWTGKMVTQNEIITIWDILFCKNKYRKQLFLWPFLSSNPQHTPSSHSPLLWRNLSKEGRKHFIVAKSICILRGQPGKNCLHGLDRGWGDLGARLWREQQPLSVLTTQLSRNEGLGTQDLTVKKTNTGNLEFSRTVSDF